MSAQRRLDLAPARRALDADTGLAPVAANDLAPGTVILAFAATAPVGAYRSQHLFNPPPAKVAEAIMRRLTCPAADLEIKTNRKTGEVGIFISTHGLVAAVWGLDAPTLRAALDRF
jgi:hypothetical protein